MNVDNLTTDPVTVLLERRRAISDQVATVGTVARAVATQLAELRTELAELDNAGRAIDALLRVNAALRDRATAAPKEPVTKRTRTKT